MGALVAPMTVNTSTVALIFADYLSARFKKVLDSLKHEKCAVNKCDL